MAHKLANRVKVNVAAAPGTGAIALGAALPTFQTPAAAGVADGDTVSYVLDDGNQVEIGKGTYAAAGPTLARTAIQFSTSGGSPINASAAATVSLTALADDLGTFPQGTAMLFAQSAAPTGWTKSTDHNDKALRIVSGSVGSGGSRDFSAVFVDTVKTGGTAISVAQMPAHNHDPLVIGGGNSTTSYFAGALGSTPSSAVGRTGTGYLGSQGGGQAHDHTMPLAVKYVDAIIATKD